MGKWRNWISMFTSILDKIWSAVYGYSLEDVGNFINISNGNCTFGMCPRPPPSARNDGCMVDSFL